MKLKMPVFFGFAIRIVLVFLNLFLITYFDEWIRKFGPELFGDIPCRYSNYGIGCGYFDKRMEWGFRHYVYIWFFIMMFIFQFVWVLLWLEREVNKKP